MSKLLIILNHCNFYAINKIRDLKTWFWFPLESIFSFLQIFRTAYVVHSDSNVGQVHCLLTEVMQNKFRSCEKHRIISTHILIYKLPKCTQ